MNKKIIAAVLSICLSINIVGLPVFALAGEVTAPTPNTSTENTPTENTPTEITPTENTPTENTPTEITPTENTPTENTPTENTPTEKVGVVAVANTEPPATKEVAVITVTPDKTTGIIYGDKVVYTIKVDKSNEGTTLVPTGTVQLYKKGIGGAADTLIGDGTLQADGTVAITANHTVLTAKNNGNHTLYAKYLGDENFYEKTSAEIETKVAPKKLTVTANDVESYQYYPIPFGGHTITGFVPGETKADLVNFSVTISYSAGGDGKSAGDFETVPNITLPPDENNYTAVGIKGKLKVIAPEITGSVYDILPQDCIGTYPMAGILSNYLPPDTSFEALRIAVYIAKASDTGAMKALLTGETEFGQSVYVEIGIINWKTKEYVPMEGDLCVFLPYPPEMNKNDTIKGAHFKFPRGEGRASGNGPKADITIKNLETGMTMEVKGLSPFAFGYTKAAPPPTPTPTPTPTPKPTPVVEPEIKLSPETGVAAPNYSTALILTAAAAATAIASLGKKRKK
ncbi:MAG: Ig-like domain repeat protein [Oscillospiraceae bacterium]